MHDLTYCLRMLRKRPSFTVLAVMTLALAIGASTALFSIVNVVVLNPFAYKDPSRLFFVRQSLPKLGVEPLLGRTIAPNEQGPNGQRVLVISYGLWQRRFGGDKAVLGQKVSLDDEPFTIIGVMPPQFRFDEGQAWFPFPFDFGQAQRSNRALAILA